MSTNLTTATTNNGVDIHVTSFSGGTERGQMIQLDQNCRDEGVQILQVDEEQAQSLILTLQSWLDR